MQLGPPQPLPVARIATLAGWIVAGVVGLRAVAGPRGGGSLEARSIRLVDAAGVARIEMAAEVDGLARVVLRDGRGRERLALRSHGDGEAVVELMDGGRLRMTLEARPTGEAGLWLVDGTQTVRSSLTATPDGVNLDLRGPSGSVHVGAGGREPAHIKLSDAVGRPVAASGVNDNRTAEGHPSAPACHEAP
jgi:hypothetical protein